MIVLTKYAIPHMKRGSSIVNSTSVTAYKGGCRAAHYQMALLHSSDLDVRLFPGSAAMLDYSATSAYLSKAIQPV